MLLQVSVNFRCSDSNSRSVGVNKRYNPMSLSSWPWVGDLENVTLLPVVLGWRKLDMDA